MRQASFLTIKKKPCFASDDKNIPSLLVFLMLIIKSWCQSENI